MSGLPKRILVVDDSQTVRMWIREELEEGGYEVVEAKNGLEALIIAASPSPPDLMTLDIEMPKMNGFETCRKLRGAHYARFFTKCEGNRMPVIFITGNDTIEDRKKGFELGAVDFISKPFRKGEILDVVDKVLNPPLVHQEIHALVADDNAVARKIASLCLSREGIEVHEAVDGLQASEIMRSSGTRMDIVITDLVMPHMDGMQLCRYIRQDLGRRHIPIVVLTAMSDHSEILEVFKAGASDYLVKPFAKEELLARIKVHIERNKATRELSKTIKLLKQADEKIERMSVLDPLTGCYNRGYLTSRIEIEIKRSIRYGTPLSIVLSDIDRFKKINNSYGHHAGDAVLIRFAETLKSVIRSEVDWVTRFGGGEFLIILPETSVSEAEIVAEKLRRAVSLEPVCCETARISVTSSFGVTGIDPASQPGLSSLDQLLRIADRNLYQAKKEGRNRVVGSLLRPEPS